MGGLGHLLNIAIGVAAVWVLLGGSLTAPQSGLPLLPGEGAPAEVGEPGADDAAGVEPARAILSPGVACLGMWSALPELAPVTPQGGRRLGGGRRAAGLPPAPTNLFACVALSDADGTVYAEARYEGGDPYSAEAWSVEIACSAAGAVGGGAADAATRCANSPIAAIAED